jgi:hypothetical protein
VYIELLRAGILMELEKKSKKELEKTRELEPLPTI